MEGSALQIAQAHQDRDGEMAAQGSLGEAYRLRGDYEQASAHLKMSLEIAQELDKPTSRASTLNNLGNVYMAQAQLTERYANSAKQRGAKTKAKEFRQKAINYYKQAQTHFQDSLQLASTQNNQFAQMRVLRNLIQLYYRYEETRQRAEGRGQKERGFGLFASFTTEPTAPVGGSEESTLPNVTKDAETTLKQALDLLKQLPDSQDKVYAAIDLAKLEQPMTRADATSQPTPCGKRQLEGQTEELLKQAVSIAQRLQDYRSESFALGELGHLYYCRQDYQNALEFTQRAGWVADQNLSTKDSLYLWEWQAGRIFRVQGQED